MAKLQMTPSEALVETMRAEGVEVCFGLVGSAFMDALDLFHDAGIRFISVAHEQAAAHAADGLARVTGRPQTCIAQNGPGIANLVSAITAALWAHSPVVALTPETGSGGIGKGGFQELDQMSMFEKSVKYQVRLNPPDRMAELARRCFYMAKAENGPTQLNIPRDYFYGSCEDEIYKTPELARGAGPREQIEEASALLAKARYPVILAGGGVSMGNAVDETCALAEHLSAPVVNSYLHKTIRFLRTIRSLSGRSAIADRKLPCARWGRPTLCSRSAAGSVLSARCRNTTSSIGPKTRKSSKSTSIRRCSA